MLASLKRQSKDVKDAKEERDKDKEKPKGNDKDNNKKDKRKNDAVGENKTLQDQAATAEAKALAEAAVLGSESDLVAVDDPFAFLDLDHLDITTVDLNLNFDEVEESIRANLDNERVKHALEQGVDLRNYVREVETDLRDVEFGSVQDYLKEASHIAELHAQIVSCDHILENMESMLGAFQTDLGSISGEIQSLQTQSLTMNLKLKNRKAVQKDLDELVQELTVTPELIKNIGKTEVSDAYLQWVLELDQKIKFFQSPRAKNAKSRATVLPVVENLRIKATEKLREFLLNNIFSIRKPNANYEMIQQTTLIRYKYFMLFLVEHSPETAAELRREYADTMGKIYFSRFKDYLGKILKLQYEELADKDDLLGAEEGSKRGFFAPKVILKNKSSVFTLGDRGEILKNIQAQVINPVVAQKQDLKFSYEAIFRSFVWALMDHARSESLFMHEFFNLTQKDAAEVFRMIFERPVDMLRKHLSEYLPTCFDSLALCICIRVIYHSRELLQKQKILYLDQVLADINVEMLKRVNALLLAHVASLREAQPKRLGSIDFQPHYIVRRYAEFAAATVMLTEPLQNSDIVARLTEMRSSTEDLIQRMANEFSVMKTKLFFLINQYDVILSIFKSRNTSKNTSRSQEEEKFSLNLDNTIGEFVQVELSSDFGELLEFTRRWLPILQRQKQPNAGPLPNFDQGAVQNLFRNFNATYKTSIDAIRNDILKHVVNYSTGVEILKKTLTALFSEYELASSFFKDPPFVNMPFKREITDIHHLIDAIKNATEASGAYTR